MQGSWRASAGLGRAAAGQGRLLLTALFATSVVAAPFLAGCSSFSSPSSSGSQATNVSPPPNYPAAAPGQPAYGPPPGQQAYAPAQPAPPPDQNSTAGSLRQSYVNFLQAFRDPPEQEASAPPAYAARPPSTYTPSQQPYVPPQGQPNYAQPSAQQNYAPPPGQPAYAPRSGQQSYTAPAAQSAYAAPAASATAAAAPAAKPDASDSLPYPKQSLTELFRDSTGPQGQTVPHPPGTYTPSGQPYSPDAAAAPPADPSDSLPYPKRSLSDIFSDK